MTAQRPKLVIHIHALSPFALKLKSYLLYKQLDFDMVYVNPLKPKLPVGRMVPVLCVEDDCRNESSELGIWLDELFPDAKPLLFGDKQNILEEDEWVSNRLIPGVFRCLLGHGDSFFSRAQKRWRASHALNATVEDGVPFWFRIVHLLRIHKIPFIVRLINATDRTVSNNELRQQLTEEFEQRLSGGPFLGGVDQPSLADLSAFPMVVVPYLQTGKQLFLQSPIIEQWVMRMQQLMPRHTELLPSEIRKKASYQIA